MSKNITIQQSGTAQTLNNIDKLRTSEIGGGSCNWVPEDGTHQAILTATDNGTFTASDDGYHSYSQVVVDVAGGGGTSVVGTWPDGNDYEFTVDDETGYVDMELLPSSIAVTTPPTNTTYTEGDTLDFSGIVVTAYCGDGSIYDTEDYPDGIVPLNELSFDPTIAPEGADSSHYDPSLSAGTIIKSYTNISTSDSMIDTYNVITPAILQFGYEIGWYSGGVQGTSYGYRIWQFQNGQYSLVHSGSGIVSLDSMSWSVGSGVQVVEYDSAAENTYDDPRTNPDMPNAKYNSAAAITVKWPRIRDSRQLETSFNITVQDDGFTGSGGGTF